MRLFRARFGLKALMVLVVICGLLAWAMRVRRDSRPAYLYAGWLTGRDESDRIQAAQELGGQVADSSVTMAALVGGFRAPTTRRRSAANPPFHWPGLSSGWTTTTPWKRRPPL